MQKYSIEHCFGGNLIKITEKEYTLNIHANNSALSNRQRIGFHFKSADESYLITAGDLSDYPSKVLGLLEDTSKQYLEVGCGLGDFIYSLAKEENHKKPIVIDPTDFILLKDMLIYARSMNINEWVDDRLETLIRRAEIIMNPEKVDLINLPLQEAFISYPHVLGSADVVIDNKGPINYISNCRYHHDVTSFEKRLLKTGGILIQN